MSGNFGFETSPSRIAFVDPIERLKRRAAGNRPVAFGLVALLAAALIGSLVVLSDNGDKARAGQAQPIASATAAAPEVAEPVVIDRRSDGEDGRLLALVKGRPLFPLPGAGSLNYVEDAPVIAQKISVLEVTGDGGLWIGLDPTQRVFVHVTRSVDENKLSSGVVSPATLQPGQTVNFTGHVRLAPDDPASLGLKDASAQQLSDQSEYIEADSLSLA